MASGNMSSMSNANPMMMGNDACKISMTWNWYTIGTCFISRSWRVESNGVFAASCIAAILLVISLEFLHRVQRDYDALLRRQDRLAEERLQTKTNEDLNYSDNGDSMKDDTATVRMSFLVKHILPTTRLRPGASKLLQRQFIRSFLHMMQFTVAYFIMLLAMSFNGYIIICIIVGAFLGPFIFSWDQLLERTSIQSVSADATSCCG